MTAMTLMTKTGRSTWLAGTVLIAIAAGLSARTVAAHHATSLPARDPPPQKDPWTHSNLLQPVDVARTLEADGAKQAIVYVGFKPLFHPGHIPGATFEGPASSPEGLETLRRWAKTLPRSTPVVIYCGCCPLVDCPNIRPAFKALIAMGFTSVRVVVLTTSFGADWVDKGLPVEGGP